MLTTIIECRRKYETEAYSSKPQDWFRGWFYHFPTYDVFVLHQRAKVVYVILSCYCQLAASPTHDDELNRTIRLDPETESTADLQ